MVQFRRTDGSSRLSAKLRLSVANPATRGGQNCATIGVYFSVILVGNSMMRFQMQVNASNLGTDSGEFRHVEKADHSQGIATPAGTLFPGIRVGDTVYVSGILSLDQTGNIVGVGDPTAQTRQVLELIRAIVEAAGGSMDDVVFNQIFLKDLGDYAAMNAVYKEYFPANPPARYCIRADLVRPEFLVEIVATAHIPS